VGTPAIIGGAFKTLKTSLAQDLHFSLSTGTPFLGTFAVTRPYRTAFMSGESGLSVLQNTYHRIARARGLSLGRVDNFIVTPDLPKLTDAADVRQLAKFIESEFEDGTECLIIDPAYLCMSLGGKAGNIFEVGDALKPLSELGQKTGCTIILIHHNNKASASTYEPAELSDLQWSGFAEWPSQWLLLSRRSKYQPDSDGEHRLWMNCGGRAGHSSLWAVDVTEGRQEDDGGRRWEVEVKSAAQARAEVAESGDAERDERAAKKLDAKREAARLTIREAMETFPDGETQTEIRKAAGLSGGTFGPAFAAMQRDGEIVKAGKIQKSNGQKYDSFRLNGTNGTQRDNPDSPSGSTHSGTGTLKESRPGPAAVSDSVDAEAVPVSRCSEGF
jgi:hypothetical protein